ncbi:hypothetical protein [Lentzea sp. NPDC004782]|uniref:hypothetical protein n=1 Tax=Lentzea sp. NPDC004782 TaxID=3154458 RepID=UPI0033AC62C4
MLRTMISTVFASALISGVPAVAAAAESAYPAKSSGGAVTVVSQDREHIMAVPGSGQTARLATRTP